MSDTARVNAARQLFADQYWTRVNDVYSSGQGDVRMALVKDDIGNWSQKSFDNDPTELLDAYRKVGLAALKTLAKAAKGTSVENLQMVSDLATNQLGSRQAAADAVADLKRERDETLARLRAIETKAKALETEYQQELEDKSGKLKTAISDAETDTKDAEAKRRLRDDSEQRLSNANSQPEPKADVINFLQKEFDAAQDAFAKAAAKAFQSQSSAVVAKARFDEINTPYREKMKAAIDQAATELDSLSRVVNALQESRSPKPAQDSAKNPPGPGAPKPGPGG